MADHAHLLHRFRAAADERGALHRRGHLPVLDQIGLGGREHVLAAGDVDLAAAEVDRVQALLHRADHVGWIVLAGEHAGVGHARHHQVGERLPPAVAGRRHAHQARVERVLHVAGQHAVLDQRGALRGRALVVDVERAAAAAEGAVVDDGDALCCHALADAAGIGAGALAVEVALQAVAHGLVQQHAGPTAAEHHRHHPGRRIDRLEVHQRLAQGFARELLRLPVAEQFGVGVPPAVTGVAALASAALLDDHLHVEPHQRPHVAGDDAVRARDEDRVDPARQAHHHLLHARVGGAQQAVDAAQRLDLGIVGHAVHGILGRVQRARARRHQRPHALLGAAARDRTRRARGRQQRLGVDVVGIGEAGLLAADRAHAHALLDRVRAVAHDAVLHRPALAPRVLEVDVAEVDAGPQQGAERALQPGTVQPRGHQQA